MVCFSQDLFERFASGLSFSGLGMNISRSLIDSDFCVHHKSVSLPVSSHRIAATASLVSPKTSCLMNTQLWFFLLDRKRKLVKKLMTAYLQCFSFFVETYFFSSTLFFFFFVIVSFDGHRDYKCKRCFIH